MTLDFRASQIRTNKIIASGSTGTNSLLMLYPYASALDSNGTIDPTKFITGSIGQDVFVYVSGAIGSLGGITKGAMVTGGDLHVSGNLRIQGSLFHAAGTLPGRLFIGRYTTTTSTSSNPQVCGQNNWSPTEFGFVSGSSTVYLQAILSAQTGSASAFVKLYNITAGAYVDIGGVAVTALSTSQTTPTKLLSVNLAGAANFTTTAERIYEVQIYTSVTSSTSFLGSAELLTQV